MLMRRFVSLSLIAFLALASGVSIPRAESADREINVAAAADLSSALQEVATNYEKRTSVVVKLSFGASGALTQQIQNGAPFDVFFSADMDYPRQLIAGGQAESATLYRYAVGRLVLWVPGDSPLDVEHKGMDVLLDPSVKKISIANPQHAPYGRAAVAALKHYGLYEKVSATELVLGENVSQAAQFVESGNAQAGFVALAHAMAPAMQGKGRYWMVPAEAYPPLDQGVVLISRSPHRQDAAAFLEYMKTAEVAGLLRRYGFSLPAEIRPERRTEVGNWRAKMAINWQAFRLTIELAVVVSVILFVVGLPLAYWIAFSRWRWKFLVEALVALPIVLPPTVLGFYVLVALGSRSPLGPLVAVSDRTHLGVHLHRTGDRLHPLQPAVRGAAFRGVFLLGRSEAAGSLGHAGSLAITHVLPRSGSTFRAGTGHGLSPGLCSHHGRVWSGADDWRQHSGSNAHRLD